MGRVIEGRAFFSAGVSIFLDRGELSSYEAGPQQFQARGSDRPNIGLMHYGLSKRKISVPAQAPFLAGLVNAAKARGRLWP